MLRPMKVETARMLSIGRFARLSGLTVKALRHYDETRHVLAALDRLIEGKEHLVTELTLELKLVDEPAGRFAVIRDRVRVDDMFTHVPETIPRVCEWLDKHGPPYDGPPLTIFLGNGIDEWLDVEVGSPIGDARVEGSDGVIVRELPAARAVEHLHRGPYEELPALYGALEAAIRERGLVPEDLAREHYLVSPNTRDDPADCSSQRSRRSARSASRRRRWRTSTLPRPSRSAPRHGARSSSTERGGPSLPSRPTAADGAHARVRAQSPGRPTSSAAVFVRARGRSARSSARSGGETAAVR
jgi:effector-binding domain-containing protein